MRRHPYLSSWVAHCLNDYGHPFRDLKAIAEANTEAGRSWFGEHEMRHFRARNYSTYPVPGKGAYFVSSSKSPYGPRRYSVHYAHPTGDVDTVWVHPARVPFGESPYTLLDGMRGYGGFKSLRSARTWARKLRDTGALPSGADWSPAFVLSVHPEVEYHVDTPFGTTVCPTFQAAETVCDLYKVDRIDVIVWSERAAVWYDGADGRDRYREDPEASVYERIERVATVTGPAWESKGRIA